MASKDTTLKELYAAQNVSMGLIARAVENFNKLGRSQRSAAVTRSRLSNLRGYWEKYVRQHMQILQLADKDASTQDEYFVNDLFQKTSCSYEEACDYFNEWLEKLNPHIVAQTSIDESNSLASPGVANSIKLPQITLPSFSGDPQEWENYRDLFLALVDQNSSLTGVQKLHYLKSSLTGEACLALKNIAITEANYSTAWDLLKRRYDNTRLIVHSYLRTLLGIPNMSSPSTKDLRSLRDKANDIRQALINLGRPVEDWDDLFNFLIISKLDRASLSDWELKLGASTALPTFTELDEFLTSRIRAFEAVDSANQGTHPDDARRKHRATEKRVNLALHQVESSVNKCFFCDANHVLAACSKFKKKQLSERRAFIFENRLCFRCLKPGHVTAKCTSQSTCAICKGKHHVLVHFKNTGSNVSKEKNAETASKAADVDAPSTSRQPDDDRVSVCHASHPYSYKALLPSARVKISAETGRSMIVRALLDQGSQVTCVTERVAEFLKVKRIPVAVSLSGVGGMRAGNVRHAVELEMSPCKQSVEGELEKIKFTALVMKSLTSYTSNSFTRDLNWKHLTDLPLADSHPLNNEGFDLLIGASEYGKVMLDGVVKGPPESPIAQRTVFGWVLSGSCAMPTGRPHSTVKIHHVELLDTLQSELTRFWELEETPQKPVLTRDQMNCEIHFANTHRRQSDGRYEVRLPFKKDPALTIGDTASVAKKIFKTTESRLRKNPELYREYQGFLREYRDLGHMTQINENESLQGKVFISHLPVLRRESQTTKLRVVFNASMKSSNGKSLNDCLHVGPNLQANLFSLLIRWRWHRFVYTADIAKMFRQIRVASTDTSFQCIFWRPSPELPIKGYRLETVTYGTACAPFHANRVLKQLAKDDGKKYPLGAATLENEFYVDDAMFGASELPLLKKTRDELCRLLMAGGFKLRKWASNSSLLLDDIPTEDHGLAISRTLQDDEKVKVLGIRWNPSSDNFHFHVQSEPRQNFTKRLFLSLLAKVYDPLGWIAPFTVLGKIILQRLWLARVGWDEDLPADLARDCEKFHSQLTEIREISIPRWTGVTGTPESVEIHGFCDASSLAYGAAVYLRVGPTPAKVSLLFAKTKVAPLKVQTIPRLELCAAELLSRAISFVLDSLRVKVDSIVCWTDSKVVLDWLNAPPGSWKPFVANRVSAVQTNLPAAIWRHVPGTQNPADCASRGCMAVDLKNHQLWWQGPHWLLGSPETWPAQNSAPSDGQAVASELWLHVASEEDRKSDPLELFSRFSSWPKLLRVIAYVVKFFNACKGESAIEKGRNISKAEVDAVKVRCFKLIHASYFPSELKELTYQRGVKPKSTIVALSPYLDDEGIIRVGGRLRNAALPETTKHPVILPRCHVSWLILRHAHIVTLHGGVQLTLRTLRQQYWIIHARTQAKKLVAACVTCVRQRAQTLQQQMGNLPRERLTPKRPFSIVGIDYAGPFACRVSQGRGQKTRKCYLALFVCLSVRAIHLEIVNDYTTAAFLAAFERFASRRGLPAKVMSDNGTNFKGACRELAIRVQKLRSDLEFQNDMATRGIDWKFIPPGAPHFGGLWEAGVKSVKHHLKRIIGTFTPTYEEFSTLTCKIECCLNSRPLYPLHDDPESFDTLTPGHFLVGSNLLAVPDVSIVNIADSRLSRWQAIQKLHERFWKLWSTDYLTALQTKTKWRTTRESLRANDLVLLRNPIRPPTHWEMGRVVEIFPGKDGRVRVVRVKTVNSEFTRPITQICKLPVKPIDE